MELDNRDKQIKNSEKIKLWCFEKLNANKN